MVFQMGKVGSSTVVKALESLSLHDPILHVHTLNPKNFDAAIARVRASINPTLPRHLFVSKFLIDKLSQKRFPCRVITLTREPVSRAFSFVFEDWKKQAPGAKSDSDLQRAHMCSALNRLLSTKNGISDPTRWFDSEVFEVFGFDVFSQPYDFEKGFVTYQKGSVSLLLIRLEDLDRSLPDALSEFLNIDASSVPKLVANQSSAKWYAVFEGVISSYVSNSQCSAAANFFQPLCRTLLLERYCEPDQTMG